MTEVKSDETKINDIALRNAQITEMVARLLSQQSNTVVFLCDGKKHWHIEDYPKPYTPYVFDMYEWYMIGQFVETCLAHRTKTPSEERSFDIFDLHTDTFVQKPCSTIRKETGSITNMSLQVRWLAKNVTWSEDMDQMKDGLLSPAYEEFVTTVRATTNAKNWGCDKMC